METKRLKKCLASAIATGASSRTTLR